MKQPNNQLNIQEFSTTYVDETFPCVVVRGITDAAPIVISGAMISGDMPLIIVHGEQRKEVARIDASAHNIAKLLRVLPGKVRYVTGPDEEHEITSITDYLNLV